MKIFDWKWWLNLEDIGPAPKTSITVAITAHNEGKWIAETIESVLAQTYHNIGIIEIIAVNDGSSDDTGSIIDSYSDQGVIAIHHDKPSGKKAHASNSALAKCTSDYIVALDADAILAPDAIENALKRFNNPKVKIVSGCITSRFSETFWERARVGEYISAFSVLKQAQNHTFGLVNASGAFSIVEVKALKDIGGYPTRTLGEDLDLTWQLRERGYRAAYANDAHCVVVDPHTKADYINQLTRWSHSFFQNLKVRNYNLFKGSPFFGLMVYGYMMWMILSPLLLPLMIWLLSMNVWLSMFYFVLSWVLIVWIPMIIKAIQLNISLLSVFKSFIPMFITQYVNIYMLIKIGIKEVILGQTETGWRRGHD